MFEKDNFRLKEEEDDARAELIVYLRSEVDRLTVVERQFKIENAVVTEALRRERARAEAAEAELARIRDRTKIINTSLRAAAPSFFPLSS